VEIIPAIDIRGGNCVRLVQGDYDRERVFADDPVEVARRWAGLGATRLHVVDLDAAKAGVPVNDAIVARIVDAVAIPVQVAGGVRDLDAVARWSEAGADRVIIGTAAVERPDFVSDAVARHAALITISVDAREDRVAVKGWTESSRLTVAVFVADMAKRGVRQFVYTDISRDGTMQHPDMTRVKGVADLVARTLAVNVDDAVPLIYAGGVTSVDDLVALADLGIEGAISGTALYDGSIDFREAVRALGVGDDW